MKKTTPAIDAATEHDELQKRVAKPLSLTDVARKRIIDRKLEKDAPKTGYPELDRIVKGFIPKHFWTITGETNTGKTALACNFAENLRKQKKKVLYVALEPEYKVTDYLASIRLEKPYDDLTDKDLFIDDPYIDIFTLKEVPTYEDLVVSIREGAARYSAIIIDHIGYFCRSSETQSFVSEQARTVRDLVSVSKELSTCIVAIAHPRKPSQGGKRRILSLYDIAGSASFAQDSTEVLVFHRSVVNEDDPYCVELKDEGYLMVHKSKQGRNGSVRCFFKKDTAQITTSEHKTVPQEEKQGQEKLDIPGIQTDEQGRVKWYGAQGVFYE